VEGDSPEQALLENLGKLTFQVREMFGLTEDDCDDEKIQEDLYLPRPDTLISASSLTRKLWEDYHNS
jgi:hypothetical protein